MSTQGLQLASKEQLLITLVWLDVIYRIRLDLLSLVTDTCTTWMAA